MTCSGMKFSQLTPSSTRRNEVQTTRHAKVTGTGYRATGCTLDKTKDTLEKSGQERGTQSTEQAAEEGCQKQQLCKIYELLRSERFDKHR